MSIVKVTYAHCEVTSVKTLEVGNAVEMVSSSSSSLISFLVYPYNIFLIWMPTYLAQLHVLFIPFPPYHDN